MHLHGSSTGGSGSSSGSACMGGHPSPATPLQQPLSWEPGSAAAVHEACMCDGNGRRPGGTLERAALHLSESTAHCLGVLGE